MNILDYAGEDRKIIVKNPDYNPRRKKNKQPEYIEVEDNGWQSNSFTSDVEQGYKQGWQVPYEYAKPYEDYGITYRPGENLDYELANAQSNWTKAFNSLAQTLVSEIGLGTLQAFPDMAVGTYQAVGLMMDSFLNKVFDVKNDPVQKAMGVGGSDYNNPISDTIEQWREKFRNEVAPVYVEPGVNIDNGGFGNFGWWAKNFPTIASSLTLLIPAKAGTAAMGWAGKGVRSLTRARKVEKALNSAKTAETLEEVNLLNKASQETVKLTPLQEFLYNPINQARLKKGAEIGSEALLMRTIENYQESHQTYNDMYADVAEKLSDMDDEEYQQFLEGVDPALKESGIDLNNKDAVAKWVSKKAADRTFLIDYSNTIFDVIQLMGLRDIGKAAKNVRSSSVMRAQRKSIETATAAGKEAAEEAAKKAGTLSKTWTAAKDFAKGSAKVALEESTEGIEEGINFIAQQEGITFGNTLLDGETDSTASGFWNSRLWDYLADPQLHESAFWGVLGGVVFAGGGNFLNRQRAYKDAKQREEARKLNEETGESIDTKDDEGFDVIAMSELTEVKAAKTAINQRSHRLTTLKEKLKIIKDGKNPEVYNEEKEDYEDLEGDEEGVELQKAVLKAKLISDYRQKIAVDALNSGTFDLLMDYIKSTPVKQAFIEKGLIDKNNADSFIADTVNELNAVKEIYNKELSHANYQIAALNKDKKLSEQIPVEYVMQIAQSNTKKRLNIRAIDKQFEPVTRLKVAVEDDDKINEEDKILARDTIRLSMLTDLYGRLEADKRAVKEDEELNDWRKAQSISDIESQQEEVLRNISQIYLGSDFGKQDLLSTNKALAGALHAIKISKAYRREGSGKNVRYYPDNTDIDYNKTDEEIIKDYKDLFNTDKENVPNIVQLRKQLSQQFEDLTGENGLYQTNRRLYDTYVRLADLQIERDLLSSTIVHSQQQIRKEVDKLHNMHNEVRKEMIAKAEKTIRDIHDKYADTHEQDVEQVVIETFMRNKAKAASIAREFLTGVDENGNKDSEKLLDALSILNLSKGSNEQVFSYLAEVLQRNAEKHKKMRENISTSENSQQADENLQTITNTQTTTEQNTDQASRQLDDIQTENTYEQPTIEPTYRADDRREIKGVKTTVNFNTGEIVSLTPTNSTRFTRNNIPSRVNDDGTVELGVSSIPKSRRHRFVFSKLFTPAEGDVLEDNMDYVITKNPILRQEGNRYVLDTPGEIRIINTNEEEVSQEEVTQEQPIEEGEQTEETQQTSSTGEVVEEDNSSTPVEDDDLFTSQPEPETAPSETQLSEAPSVDNVTDDEIKLYVNQHFGRHINLATQNPDWETAERETAEVIRAEQQELSPERLDSILNILHEEVNNIRQTFEQLQNNISAMDASASAVVLAARFEEPDTMTFGDFFTKSIADLIKEYAEVVGAPKVDGKICIRLRDILNICNNTGRSTDTTIVDNLYNLIKNYLFSPQGEVSYNVLDREDAISGEVLKQVGKTSEELYLDKFKDLAAYSLNITADMTANKTRSIFDNLKEGDTLTLSVGNKGLVFTKENTIIGTIPFAEKGKGKFLDRYIKYNSGWRTDVKIGENGEVISECRDVIKTILTDKGISCSELRNLLAEWQLSQYIKDESEKRRKQQAIIAKFKNNSFISGLVTASLNSTGYPNNIFYVEGDTVNYKNLFNYLYNLWSYTANAVNADSSIQIQQDVLNNLDRWFRKLYDTYDMAAKLAEHINSTELGAIDVPIINIADGEVRTISFSPFADYDKLKLPSEALADNSSPKLAIVDYGDKTVMNIGNPTNDDTPTTEKVLGFNKGETYITINSNNTNRPYIRAFGLRVSEYRNSPNNTLFKELISASGDYLSHYIYKLSEDLSETNYKQFVEALKNIFHSGDATLRTSLIRPADNGGRFEIKEFNFQSKNKVEFRGVELAYYVNGRFVRSVKIYTKGAFGNQFGFAVKEANNTLKETPEFTVPNEDRNAAKLRTRRAFLALTNMMLVGQINISPEAVKGDNGTSTITKGVLKHETVDGKTKFVVDMNTGEESSSYRKEFDSYNDFIIGNNLIRVNTQKDSTGSNFIRRSAMSKYNQQILVSLPTPDTLESSSSEEAMESVSNVANDSDANMFNEVKQIMAINKTNPVLDIIKLVKGEEFYNNFVEKANALGILDDLFPKDLIYKDAYNWIENGEKKGNIAETNITNGPARVGIIKNGKHTSLYLRKGGVMVGSRLLDMLSSNDPNKRNRGIRKLIHERIHQVLHSPGIDTHTELKRFVRIYNEFVEALNDRLKTETDEALIKQLEHIKKLFKNYRGDTLLEEFITETLTNEVLYNFLNSVESSSPVEDSNNRSLLDKILDFIKDLFHWEQIEDNSLLKDFINLTKELGNTSVSFDIQTNETLNDTSLSDEASTRIEPTEELEPVQDETVGDTIFDETTGLNIPIFDFDDSDTAPAVFEEMDARSFNETRLKSVGDIKKRLPMDVVNNFDKLINTGVIEYKC